MNLTIIVVLISIIAVSGCTTNLDIVNSCKKCNFINECVIDSNCLIQSAENVDDCKSFKNVVTSKTSYNTRYFNEFDLCIEKVAINANDLSICDSSENQREECIIQFAIELNNPESCKKNRKSIILSSKSICRVK